MSTPAEPAAPDSLLKYLADGIPKQDRETLENISEYVEALLNYRDLLDEQPIDESKLPDDAEIVDDGSKSSILHEYRTCGDESCRCMSSGEKHGPYRYRVYQEGGSVKKEYLGKPMSRVASREICS